MSLGLLTVPIFTLCIAQVYQRLAINPLPHMLSWPRSRSFAVRILLSPLPTSSLSLPRLGVALRWQESPLLDQPQSEPLEPCDSHGPGFDPYSENGGTILPTRVDTPPVFKKISSFITLSFVASTGPLHPLATSVLYFTFRRTGSPFLSTSTCTNLI